MAAVVAPPLKQDGHAVEPFFAEEREGWKGYIEWENYPEKKKQAAEVLARNKFPEVR